MAPEASSFPDALHARPCSWMNQVEQWFSILQRKRLSAPNFADLDASRGALTRLHCGLDRDRSPLRLDDQVVRQDSGEDRCCHRRRRR